MKYRTLPGTDLRVSEICLGTMTWGEQNSEADAHAQLDCAVAHGVNFIDTAEMYPVPPNARTQGRTEAHFGSWLARRGREGLVIASKVAGPGRREWIRNGRTDLTRDVIAEAVDTSLARLRIDCIDLYQIHWPQRNVPMFGATEFDPAKETEGPPIQEQVEGMAAIDQGRQDPPLRTVERDGVGRVRVPARCAGAGRAGSGHDPEQLQSRLPWRRQRSRGNALPREDVAARLQSAGRRHPGGQIPGRGATSGHALHAVRRRGRAFPQADRARGERSLRRAGEAARHLARATRAWLREESLVSRRSHHRRDDMAQLEENIAAGQFELDGPTLAEIAAMQIRYPNPAG